MINHQNEQRISGEVMLKDLSQEVLASYVRGVRWRTRVCKL